MPTYESKESQTTPDQDLLLSSSKVCQIMKLEPAIAFENRETQTLPDGDMFLTSSTECQTEPYRLDDMDSMPPDHGLKGSQDTELSDDANVGEYPDTHSSPQMASRNRPATYGKSPEETEESFFGFQANGDMDATELCHTNVELASRPLGSALTIDVSEKGVQAMLCSCGNCADDQESAGASSDPQKGTDMRVSEGIQKEQASLIKQLDMLRDMNQKLRDDKDAIEAAHEAKKERGYSLSDEIEEAEKKTKVSRQGSQMSKYVKKRRAPAPEETWGNQGSVESLSGEDVPDGGPNNKSDSTRSRRRSKRRDMKKQGSVLYSYFSNSSQGSASLHDSIQEEAEFDGDPTLELISDEKLQEDGRPAWAKK
ncbi:Calcium release activated channel regulator [Desmophyllum pertusum]|uniref:Calcium release activated channel regulator n=1 Tax=Desmophyllum pertusum TaxID=174260 RepID=A0A9X0CNT9_9CNID|nr:Calcium release activated channel regulator [Desmophyllum pertusum]